MLVFKDGLFKAIYYSMQPYLIPIICFDFTQIFLCLLHLFTVLFFIRQLKQKQMHLPLRSSMMPADTALMLDDFVYKKMIEGIVQKVQSREKLVEQTQKNKFMKEL